MRRKRNRNLVFSAGRKGEIIGPAFRPEHYSSKKPLPRTKKSLEVLVAQFDHLTAQLSYSESVLRKVEKAFRSRHKVTRIFEAKMMRKYAEYFEIQWKLKQFELGLINAKIFEANKKDHHMEWLELVSLRRALRLEQRALENDFNTFSQGAEEWAKRRRRK